MSLLEVKDLRIGFAGKSLVHGVSFQVNAGERVALVGESGSGKSITAMSLLHLLPGAQVSGEARYAGNNLLTLNQAEIRGISGRDIAMIFQEPMTALNPLKTAGEQIAEIYRLHRDISGRNAWSMAIERLKDTGIPEPERRAHAYPHQLSGGQRQRVMIAMALAGEPKLLLADEPTTALDVTLRVQMLDLISELQQRNGMAVLLITHDLHLVRRFADRVLVMEKGILVEDAPTERLFNSPKHPYTCKLLSSRPDRRVAPVDAGGSDILRLRAKDVQVRYPRISRGLRQWFRPGWHQAVNHASLELRKGQTVGIIGESGSGKTSLANAVLGLITHQGLLEVDGVSWQQARRTSRAAYKDQRRKIQAVFQDPYSSLSPRLTIEQIIGEGLQFHAPHLSFAQRRQRIIALLAEVGLHQQQFPDLLKRHPHAFSGGQRQRIAIARALIVEPDVVVLDEPTSALDVTVQKQVVELLQDIQRDRGLSYLVITHDVTVVAAMAHQVLVMKEGQVVEAGETIRLLSAPVHPYTRALIDAAQAMPLQALPAA
ncbi:ABC transporter ATP-binding protein [Biostraticola tofi]|uniref:ABC-type dipeptide transporter n=1 Tax=Biostraticola tofi TaxID=466109 RepID=A0A4R3Z4M9_9GAMM|nr:dipeptide ABC transporter ATP-binding protein [Biostraticola tofi]TCV98868.1 microcin C transport system ATP-binding protein [Biostraticola tofi]